MPGYGCGDDIANDGEQGAQNGSIRKSAAGKTVRHDATVECLSCKGRRSPGSKYAASDKLVVGNGHGPCAAGYSMWPLQDMVSEAEAFFLLDLVCSLICVVLDTKALPRLPIERSPFYSPLGISQTRPCPMQGVVGAGVVHHCRISGR